MPRGIAQLLRRVVIQKLTHARGGCAHDRVLRCWSVVGMFVIGSRQVWKTIFAIWAFARAKMVRNEMCIDNSGILEGSG